MSVAGLKTTVLPHTSAGAIFHDGIAIGKFHGVIAPTTPIGCRTLMLNLSRSSDGVVCPKQAASLAGHVEAHVDRFLHVAAGLGLDLPHLVGHQVGEVVLLLDQEIREAVEDSRPRFGAGTRRHSSNAAFAASTARSTSSAFDLGKTPIESPVAGLVLSNVSPDAESTHSPPM